MIRTGEHIRFLIHFDASVQFRKQYHIITRMSVEMVARERERERERKEKKMEKRAKKNTEGKIAHEILFPV